MNFEVSITPSWVVEACNGIESSHFYSSCQLALGFSISFQSKPCLAPHLILLDCSMCYELTKAFDLPPLYPTSSDGYMWSSRKGMKYKAYLYHIYCKVKKPDPKRKTNHTIRSRCARVWIMVDGMETPFVWSLSLSLSESF